MDKIKDIRQDLINEIMNIDDVDSLKSLYQTIEQNRKADTKSISQKIEEAITEVKEDGTLDAIVSEQNIEQITYAEITNIVENISWEVSLEELLASID